VIDALEKTWLDAVHKHFPDAIVQRWTIKDRGMVRNKTSLFPSRHCSGSSMQQQCHVGSGAAAQHRSGADDDNTQVSREGRGGWLLTLLARSTRGFLP